MIGTQKVARCLACGGGNYSAEISTDTMMGDVDGRWDFVRCDDCDLVYLNPQVIPEGLHSFYTAHYLPYQGSAAWGKYKFFVDWDQKSVDRARVQTLSRFVKKRDFSVLDVGCGKPSFLAEVKKVTNGDTIGLDFSDKGWKGDAAYDTMNLQVGEVADLDLDTAVDAITMWHYLEHDYEPVETLRGLLGFVHADTRLVIEVPHHDSYSRRTHGRHWAGYHSPRHTALYTPDTMSTLLRRSGWTVVDKYSYGTLDPYTLDWMSRMEAQGIDWSQSMEGRFVSFVLGKLSRPRYFFPRKESLGFMTVVARPSIVED